MNAIDLRKALKPYKSGWVALDKKLRVVARAKNFAEISKKAKRVGGVMIVPASKNYFGFISEINVEASLFSGS